MYNEIINQDIEEIIRSEYIDIKDLKNKVVLVTGATGMIGSMIVWALIRINEKFQTNMEIFALARNEDKLNRYFSVALENKAIIPIIQDITEPIVGISAPIDYVIHTANTTSSMDFLKMPTETMSTIFEGTKNMLIFSKQQQVQSFVYLSSMEVYGIVNLPNNKELHENELGHIDILNERNSYPESKRMAECLCYAYFKEYNLPIKISRLSQTLGANVGLNDNRVFAEFARKIALKEDIVMHTTGETTRNYAYVTDTITAIFKILQKGIQGECYNIANKETTISIREMAENLCKSFPETKLKQEIDFMARGYNPTLKVILSTHKLETLGWQAKVNLDEMYTRLIESFSIQKATIKNLEDTL